MNPNKNNSFLWLLVLPFVTFLQAGAAWVVNPEKSFIYFTTYKNVDIAESHSFSKIQGQVNEVGLATIDIQLDSLNTNIPIRDQRMKEMLFETQSYPKVTITAQLDKPWLQQVDQGISQKRKINAKLSLHGKSKDVKLHLFVTKTQKGEVVASSIKPVIINAEFWGLHTGVEKLKKVAGLNSISLSVPVSFTINFSKTP